MLASRTAHLGRRGSSPDPAGPARLRFRFGKFPGEAADGVLGRGRGPEQLLLSAGVCDVSAGIEPAEHRRHVLDYRPETSGDGG